MRARGHSVVRRVESAISLPELIIVIAVLGILAAIAIPHIGGVTDAAREGFSDDEVALVNRAVLHYEQANAPIDVAADNAGFDDEEEVIAKLKTRDDTVPGSPFLESTFSVDTSTDSQTHRMIWNGTNFEVRLPGESGAGILLNTD